MARNFSASLNDAFAMDSKLDGLVQSVEQKYYPMKKRHRQRLTEPRKQAVSSQNAELEALEAKLRETEERLKEQRSRTSSPAGRAAGIANSPHRRKPLGKAFDGQENDKKQQSQGKCPLASQTSTGGPVSAATMAHWRSGDQEASPGENGKARDLSAEQLSGQQGARFSQ